VERKEHYSIKIILYRIYGAKIFNEKKDGSSFIKVLLYKADVMKVNFGCFNSNVASWIGVDHALRHIIIQRIPLLSYLL
jgi:hypothetical protein